MHHLQFAQVVDGVEPVVVMRRYRIASQVQDDELQQPPQVTHLPDPLHIVAATVQLHQWHKTWQACINLNCEGTAWQRIGLPWHLVYCAEAECLNFHAGVKRGGLNANNCSGSSSEHTVSYVLKEQESYMPSSTRNQVIPEHSSKLACDPAAKKDILVSRFVETKHAAAKNGSRPEHPCIICSSSTTASPTQSVHTLP